MRTKPANFLLKTLTFLLCYLVGAMVGILVAIMFLEQFFPEHLYRLLRSVGVF